MKNPLCCTALPKVIWWLLAITITPLLFFFMLYNLEATVLQQEINAPSKLDAVNESNNIAKHSDEFLYFINGCIRGDLPFKLCKKIYHIKKENKKSSALSVIKLLFPKPNKN
jgi:hypothetical protein